MLGSGFEQHASDDTRCRRAASLLLLQINVTTTKFEFTTDSLTPHEAFEFWEPKIALVRIRRCFFVLNYVFQKIQFLTTKRSGGPGAAASGIV